MPYIPQDLRQAFKPQAATPRAEHPGILNFQITHLVDEFIRVNGLSYSNINAAMGALEGAKLELYRRLAAPYEDKKIEENGDVYSTPR